MKYRPPFHQHHQFFFFFLCSLLSTDSWSFFAYLSPFLSICELPSPSLVLLKLIFTLKFSKFPLPIFRFPNPNFRAVGGVVRGKPFALHRCSLPNGVYTIRSITSNNCTNWSLSWFFLQFMKGNWNLQSVFNDIDEVFFHILGIMLLYWWDFVFVIVL